MKTQNRQKLIVVLGATASGKTSLARQLAQKFGGCIISADSRQVYRYMDIGTGKVDTFEELVDLKRQRNALCDRNLNLPADYVLKLEGVPHYMIDIVLPNEEYNVALYQKDVYAFVKNESPAPHFLVGGTGQYIDAVVDNWQFPEGEPNYALRFELEQRIASEGVESVWNELISLDSACAEFVQKNNFRRVARALEYVLSTGKKFSGERGKGERQFNVLKIGISLPREELYKKIDARVEARLKLGMIEEVENLHRARGLSFEQLHRFGLEYRVIADYLSGKFSSFPEMRERLKWNIHAYARRQLTWFRKGEDIQWISEYEKIQRAVERFLFYH